MNSRIILMMACVLMNAFLCGSAGAFCEQPPAKLCNVFFSNELVIHAKVIKSEVLKKKGDPGAGWLYYLEVLKTYRGKVGKLVTVSSENTTARLLLKPGNEYIVFASRNPDGTYEAGNYCGEVQPVDGEPYSARLEQQIRELASQTSCVIEGEVRDSNWNLVSGAKLEIRGSNIRKKVTVDKNGLFSVTIPPGTYKVLIPKNLHVTEYSMSVAGKDLDEIRPLSIVAGQCVQIQLQER